MNQLETYVKRKGTSNKGIEYEILNLAYIVLNVFENKTSFKLSTNDSIAGDFDDVCLEMNPGVPNKLFTCIQLKHSADNKPLYPKHLETSNLKADFGVFKYCTSYIHSKIKADRLILSTNKKFFLESDSLQLTTEEHFQMKLSKLELTSEDFLNTSNMQDCYKFELLEESVIDKSKIEEYKDFFSKFFLYTNQADVYKLKQLVQKKFEKLLGLCSEFDSFLNWIGDWWKRDGTKVKKLNLEWIQNYFQILFFSSKMKVIRFGSTNLNDKQIILKNIIFKFKISVFEKSSFSKLEKLWAASYEHLTDLVEINQVIINFKIGKPVKNIQQLDNKTKNILLWYWNVCPLIIVYSSDFEKVLNYFPKKNYIFLLEENESFSMNVPHFRNLSDIKSKNELIEKFSFFVQDKILSLKNFIGKNENVMNIFSSDILLSMSNSNPRIGGTYQNVSFYQNRKIATSIIDLTKYLNRQLKNNIIIVIESISDLTFFKHLFPSYEFIKFNATYIKNLNCSKSIFVYSDEIIDLDYLHKFVDTSKFEQIHKFKIIGNEFEWVSSKTSVNDLKDFVQTKFETETNFWNSEFNHKLNLLVDRSGMGKTEFLKNLCNNGPSGFWPILIQSKDMDVFSKYLNTNKTDKLQVFEEFLLYYKYQNLTYFEKQILLICLNLKKILYLWDGLDEISTNNFEDITDFILELSKKNYIQWVTSRSHLRTELETKFNVLAKHFKDFDETEQDQYIKSRFEDFKNIDVILFISKIRKNFRFIEHKNILGIPLLLFMVTELLQLNPDYFEKLKQSFLLIDCYEFFIEQKFKICQEKLKLASTNNEAIYEILQNKLIISHQNKSLLAILPLDFLKEINIPISEDTKKIEELIISAGLITDIENGLPRFIHKSFAEYFVAKYLFENYNNERLLNSLKTFIFDTNFTNVRFFFDLFLAEGSKAHIAVLYQNFALLEKFQDDSNDLCSKDKGGRSPLHLLSSWGQPHPELQVQKREDRKM